MTERWGDRPTERGEGLVLGVLLGGVGRTWFDGATEPDQLTTITRYVEQARLAEAARIHTIFLADGLTVNETAPEPGLEPVTLLSALSGFTERIGLVGSVSTTFTEPYNLARQIASLDHISRGRAGWNLVTSAWGEANFGRELPAHDDRYAIAEEFAGVVEALWDSWDADAIVADRDRGILVDPARVHRIDWVSKHFSVRGPLNVPRSPQGRPIIAQAGSSEAGRSLAARHADVVFTTGLVELEPSVELYDDIKGRAIAAGRAHGDIKILPGVAPVIGSTDEEAHRFWVEAHEKFDWEKGRASLAGQFAGVDFDGIDLDAPVPLSLLPEEETVQGRRSRYGVLLRLIRSGRLRTVRDVILYHASAAGHWFPIGSVESIADQLQERYERGAADGFNILAFVQHYPGGLEAVTDHLVPELQRRGIFHTEYEHATLRGNLGLTPALEAVR
ncbi:NtaA/DmoA family FMN-dependent monooxygenase [Microbacterium sp. E-13]|uniref:NtaA/DmoA family FMN-dependent monooxygenase n=1 Tax=Microbacterium sp. E-13 TaxID=3404048 RepID=UPI003CF01BBF